MIDTKKHNETKIKVKRVKVNNFIIIIIKGGYLPPSSPF